ncbi:MAG: XRE family transcriptional regulator [Methylococcaceae bacterium]|nr:MAG: XRE family transcriptional regulator [Methylococcaceae bacterium]
MNTVQYIEHEGHRLFAVVPIDLWNQLTKNHGDKEGVTSYNTIKDRDGGYHIPSAVRNAEMAGTHTLKAWREYRGLTQDALAQAVGISTPYLCQIETGKRTGTTKVHKAFARVLNVPLSVLAVT